MSDKEEFRRPAEDANDDEEWETVEAAVAKPVDVVLSVRLDQETAARLRQLAAAKGRPASRLIREAIAVYLNGPAEALPVPNLTISAIGNVSFYAGQTKATQTKGVSLEVPLEKDLTKA